MLHKKAIERLSSESAKDKTLQCKLNLLHLNAHSGQLRLGCSDLLSINARGRVLADEAGVTLRVDRVDL